jgi:hypothetical protein
LARCVASNCASVDLGAVAAGAAVAPRSSRMRRASRKVRESDGAPAPSPKQGRMTFGEGDEAVSREGNLDW